MDALGRKVRENVELERKRKRHKVPLGRDEGEDCFGGVGESCCEGILGGDSSERSGRSAQGGKRGGGVRSEVGNQSLGGFQELFGEWERFGHHCN